MAPDPIVFHLIGEMPLNLKYALEALQKIRLLPFPRVQPPQTSMFGGRDCRFSPRPPAFPPLVG